MALNTTHVTGEGEDPRARDRRLSYPAVKKGPDRFWVRTKATYIMFDLEELKHTCRERQRES